MMTIGGNALIEKKRRDLLEKGVKVKKWRAFPRTMMTLFGPLRCERTALIAATLDDERRLLGLTGEKTLFPLDMALGIDKLPFKLSVGAMLEIAPIGFKRSRHIKPLLGRFGAISTLRPKKTR